MLGHDQPRDSHVRGGPTAHAEPTALLRSRARGVGARRTATKYRNTTTATRYPARWGATLACSVANMVAARRLSLITSGAWVNVGASPYSQSVTPPELILVASLGSATLTAAASLGVIWVQEWRRERASSRADLVQAVETVLGKSLAITMRAQQWSTLAQAYSKPLSKIDVILRAQKPLDLQLLFEPMIAEHESMIKAASRLWMEKDQRTVASVNDVVVSAADVTAAVMPTPPTGLRAKLGFTTKGWGPPDEKELKRVTEKLALARKALAEQTRFSLGRGGIDLFALPHGEIGTRPPPPLAATAQANTGPNRK
jgi:hypothetical protein